jgi:hypothetical protein
MGLPAESDWDGAQWIGNDNQKQLRVAFDVPAGAMIKRARAYVAAPGCHSIYVNGKAGGDELGVCPWTQFGHTVLYQTHDLTSMLKAGANAVGLYIGNGMYTSHGGKGPTAKAKITIDYTSVDYSANTTQRMVIITNGTGPPPPPSPGPTPPLPKPTTVSACGEAAEHTNLTISCQDKGTVISEVVFASFGTPRGDCTKGKEDFAIDQECHAAQSMDIATKNCKGKASCDFTVACANKKCHLTAGGQAVILDDPCDMVKKHFDVAVKCSAVPSSSSSNAPSSSSSNAPTVVSSAGSFSWMAADGPLRTVGTGKGAIPSDDPFVGTTTDLHYFEPPSIWAVAGYPADNSTGKGWTTPQQSIVAPRHATVGV